MSNVSYWKEKQLWQATAGTTYRLQNRKLTFVTQILKLLFWILNVDIDSIWLNPELFGAPYSMF